MLDVMANERKRARVGRKRKGLEVEDMEVVVFLHARMKKNALMQKKPAIWLSSFKKVLFRLLLTHHDERRQVLKDGEEKGRERER